MDKEEIFKNIRPVSAGERMYRIIDDDGYFIRVIPQYITGKMVAGEGTHIVRKSDGKNMGTELVCYTEFLDEDYNYYPNGYICVHMDDFTFKLNENDEAVDE